MPGKDAEYPWRFKWPNMNLVPSSMRRRGDQDVISENKEIAQPRAATAQDVEEIREYLRTRQAKRRVIKTTRTQQGQELDWVEPASQTPDGRVAARPPGDGESNLFGGGSPNDHTRWPQTPAQFELEVNPAPRGPRGTVPLVRRGPSRLRTTGNLQDLSIQNTAAAPTSCG